eukprot:CAMPEP_0204532138 /NCGR_PEP_ID=MMETSP0661-20131031/11561_1 /ASSEMBLY_ACC=CAM_ASM_000606 /TAXON_ID=109239 /ORGANISM="Alexandrium margalefi, Strain AMGDE01CS-322" /LENGTH=291 /DNA_ID=CAMNT_0051538357 /DNA_START=68 /DNA_END=943 /DNA_ORIENTATION=-
MARACLLAAFLALASGTCSDDESCSSAAQADEDVLELMQRELRTSRQGKQAQAPALAQTEGVRSMTGGAPWEPDMNGRPCMLCQTPYPERSDRKYVQRTDCGNNTLLTKSKDPSFKEIPLITFSRPAGNGRNATTAWCELNFQKMCADGIYNRDFLFQAKSITYRLNWDSTYCYLNGWLAPEFVALQHDFDGMNAKQKALCASPKYMQYGWNSTYNYHDFENAYDLGNYRGYPTYDEAIKVGAFQCAMGNAGCDISYCAYSYCDLGNGVIGRYSQCPGWDPVKGMPMPGTK